MFSLIFAWIDEWVNNREAGDFGRHRIHYDVTVMRQLTTDGVLEHDIEMQRVALENITRKFGQYEISAQNMS